MILDYQFMAQVKDILQLDSSPVTNNTLTAY